MGLMGFFLAYSETLTPSLALSPAASSTWVVESEESFIIDDVAFSGGAEVWV